MPPKSTCPPRRGARTTARKSTPFVPPKSTLPLPESPHSVASNSSPVAITSPIKVNATATTSASASASPLASPGKPTSPVTSLTGNSAANLSTLASPEKPISNSANEIVAEATNSMESVEKTQFQMNSNVESGGEIGGDETAVPAAAVAIGAENAVVGQRGSVKPGTRTVVRRTVRVVKKLVKKKVPKRVLRSQAGQGYDDSAAEKAEVPEEKIEAGNGGEKGDSLVFPGEKSVTMEVDKLNVNDNACMEIRISKEIEKHNDDGNALMEVENLNKIEKFTDQRFCGDIAKSVSNISDLNKISDNNCNETNSEEVEKNENRNFTDAVLMEAENLNANVTPRVELNPVGFESCGFGAMEIESTNSVIDVSGRVNKKKSENHEGVRDGDEVSPVAVVLDASGAKNDVDVGGNAVDVADAIMEDQNAGLKENQVVGTIEDHDAGSVGVQNVDNVEDKQVESMGDQRDEVKTRDVVPGSGECEEAMKQEVVNGEAGGSKPKANLGDKILLSGEMEALERRRRRRTELFIGGLGKDIKEEDIRKVFEEVGEVTEVRLMMNGKTGKNKGFAFVRYASADDAKKALAKYRKVEICGKQCGSSPVEGNDTIFLGNINKKWKTEDVVKVLQEIGIDKIDKVTVMDDPNNVELNRGFAFLELETCKDAQIAFSKLQKKDVFGKNLKIKVSWAEPLIEPDEEEMQKVKSVYAEYLPSTWDEEKVKEYFGKFGEIETVALARNLRSSKRNDFAFINYETREAAFACIEAFRSGELDDESKANVKVSLAKPMPKVKQIKQVSNATGKEPPKKKHKSVQPMLKPHEPRKKGISISSDYEDNRVGRGSSTNAELVRLLREQASWQQRRPNVSMEALPILGMGPRSIVGMEARPTIGMGSVDLDYTYPIPGRKRPFPIMGDDPDPLYSDNRGYSHRRVESSYPVASPSTLSQGAGRTGLSYHGRHGAGYMSELYYGIDDYPSYLQTREAASYHGSSGLYRRY